MSLSVSPSPEHTTQVTCQRPVCLEVFSEYKQLGRFTLREAGKSIAAGNVMRLLS
jgi:translation elongation factor EF-1alpha